MLIAQGRYASVPDAYAQHVFEGTALCACISTCRVCSVLASVPCAHAEGIQNEHLKNRKNDAYAEHARKEQMRMVSMPISS